MCEIESHFVSRDVPGQRDIGTRKFLCPGTKGQRDVPVCPGTFFPAETLDKRGPAEIAKPNLAYSLKISFLRLHLKKLTILRI